MVRILPKRIFLILFTFALICWSTHLCFSWSSKPPPQPCADCYTSTGVRNIGSVSITNLPAEYQAGQTYKVGVSISHPDQKRWGFLLKARDSSDNSAGSFSSIDGNTQTFSGYISRVSLGTFRGQSNGANWNLK